MNPLTPSVQITLDKERNLILDLNAMVAFEKASGKTLFGAVTISAEYLRDMLWACLLAEDPAITPDDVGRLVSMGNLSYVTEKVSELLNLSLPESEGGEAGDPLPGSESGQSEDTTSD